MIGPLTSHSNPAVPDAPLVSRALTVTVRDPDVVGVPEIKPETLIDSPGGSTLAT